jgi:hypothetical protein
MRERGPEQLRTIEYHAFPFLQARYSFASLNREKWSLPMADLQSP